jgi:hypothetical protein
MKALVLGIDHIIQYQDDMGRLRGIISQLCDERDCDLIAEEWNAREYKGYPTVGRLIASEKSIRWLTVNVPDRVSEKLGILDDLKRRRPTPDNDDQLVSEIPMHCYLPRADCIRERRWLRKIMKSRRHNSVIVLCGLIHVKPFAAKLRDASFKVSAMSLCEHEWYRRTRQNLCAEVAKELTDDRY